MKLLILEWSFSDTPAVNSGVKQAQVFVGMDPFVPDAYPMKRGKQFFNILEDEPWTNSSVILPRLRFLTKS